IDPCRRDVGFQRASPRDAARGRRPWRPLCRTAFCDVSRRQPQVTIGGDDMAINSTSFNNTPQAGDDLFTSVMTGLTEDTLFIAYLAVMANDLGGAAKT